MTSRTIERRSSAPALRAWQAVALLCVLLAAVSGVVQAAHMHAPEDGRGGDHCPLCVLLQSALPVLAAALLALLQCRWARPEPVAGRAAEPLWNFDLASRPPPARA